MTWAQGTVAADGCESQSLVATAGDTHDGETRERPERGREQEPLAPVLAAAQRE